MYFTYVNDQVFFIRTSIFRLRLEVQVLFYTFFQPRMFLFF